MSRERERHLVPEIFFLSLERFFLRCTYLGLAPNLRPTERTDAGGETVVRRMQRSLPEKVPEQVHVGVISNVAVNI